LKKYLLHFTVTFASLVFLSTGCRLVKDTAGEKLRSVATQEPIQKDPPLPKEANKGLLPAPDFTLQDLQQNTVALSSYKNKQPVVLLFWTTWCPYCREELRVLSDKYAQLAVDGWQLFAVDIAESASKVDSFVKRYSLPFKVLLDKTTSVAKSFQVMGVPTYIFINKDGYIIAVEHYFPQEEYKKWIKK